MRRFVLRAIEQQEGFRPGTLAWQNKNPGNLKYTKFTRERGAIGKDDQGHAIFATVKHGRRALRQLMERPKYTNKSLRQIGKMYAEDPKWAHGVSKLAGIDIDEVVT